ncbi:MAG: DsbA family oxidoreductase [Actinomycetota bacterium]
MTTNGSLKVWIDFLCPWARIGAFWISNVEAAGKLDLEIEWKTFSLENVNLPEEASADELWDTPAERRGLIPAAAAKWLQTNAPESFPTYLRAMFDARHVDKEKIGKPDVTAKILTSAGLDGTGIVGEVTSDPKWLLAARADHDEANELRIFGVPTFVFPGVNPVFVRLLEVTEGDRAVQLYERVRAAADDALVHEIKRPSLW